MSGGAHGFLYRANRSFDFGDVIISCTDFENQGREGRFDGGKFPVGVDAGRKETTGFIKGNVFRKTFNDVRFSAGSGEVTRQEPDVSGDRE